MIKSEYMESDELMKEMYEKVHKDDPNKSKDEKVRETALSLKKSGLAPELIAMCTGLSEEEIKNLIG